MHFTLTVQQKNLFNIRLPTLCMHYIYTDYKYSSILCSSKKHLKMNNNIYLKNVFFSSSLLIALYVLWFTLLFAVNTVLTHIPLPFNVSFIMYCSYSAFIIVQFCNQWSSFHHTLMYMCSPPLTAEILFTRYVRIISIRWRTVNLFSSSIMRRIACNTESVCL